jgi:hypothetical protein
MAVQTRSKYLPQQTETPCVGAPRARFEPRNYGNVDRVGCRPSARASAIVPNIKQPLLRGGARCRAIRAYRFFRNPQASDAAQCDVAAHDATRHRY